jgi:hypothetical protein
VAEKRFPYEQSSWSDDAEQKRRWYEALERMGPAHARARLAEIKAGSRAVSIGMEVGITKGFVEEWLAWHDRQERERERSFRRFWTPLDGSSSRSHSHCSCGEFGTDGVAEVVVTCAAT